LAENKEESFLYKVFIADDEIVFREGIRNNFPWEESGFTLCGEAPDGEIALSMIQDLRPDVLITDIRMPFMDGMALCRSVTSTMPWTHIIILSGYDDFAYAQEAISLGVKEYLLKPVSVMTLRHVLARIAGLIAQERAQRADLDSLKKQLASSTRLIQEKLISRVFDGTFTNTMLSESRAVHLSLTAKQYVAMIIETDTPERLLETQAIVQRLSEGAGGTILYAESSARIRALVLGDTVADVEERAYAHAQTIMHEAERIHDIKPRIAIGTIVSIMSDIPHSLLSAQEVLGSLNIMETRGSRILGAADVEPGKILSMSTSEPDMPSELLKADIEPLFEKLQFAKVSDIPKIVEEYLNSFGDTAVQSMLVMHYALVDILLAGSRVVKRSGGEPEEVLPESLNRTGLLQTARTRDEIVRLANDLLRKALVFRDERYGSASGSVIRKACAYIEANYHRPEITLQEVARHAGLSNNHFCTVFSQKMGLTFIEYITRLRLEKACKYLRESDLRSDDIAERIGYSDTRYFRYLFKKGIGMSPREYRGKTDG